MTTPKLEVRGIECLHCQALDLKPYPEQAAGGFGMCKTKGYFVAFYSARNCADYERAGEDLIAGREKWNTGRRTIP